MRDDSGGFDAASPRKALAKDTQTPPAALDFEAAVLGACMVDLDAVATAREHMAIDDCYDLRHRLALQGAWAIADEGRCADALAVHDWLRERGHDGVVTLAFLLQAALSPGSTSAVEHYARKIRRCRYMRDALDAAARLLAEGFDPRCDPDAFDALWGNIDAKMRAFILRGGDTPEIGMVEAAASLYDRFARGEVLPPGLPTGLPRLDKALAGGTRPGNLIVVAGRPGHGKTSLAIGMIRKACELGKHVATVSLEMTARELHARMVSSMVRFDVTKTAPTPENSAQVQDAASRLSEFKWRIFDTGGANFSALDRWIAGLHTNLPLDLVIIDNLQDIALTASSRARHEELDSTVRKCKAMAKTLGCPVVLLAQANREIDERGVEGYYRQADVADTKALEGASDVLMFPWQPPPDTHLPPGYAEIQIVKNRAGALATLRADYDAGAQSFTDTWDYAINRRKQQANARTPPPPRGHT